MWVAWSEGSSREVYTPPARGRRAVAREPNSVMSGWLCVSIACALWLRFAPLAPAEVAASGPAPVEDAAPALPPPGMDRVLGWLQYVAGDYAAAVTPEGRRLSDEEFEEQLGLLERIAATLCECRDTRARPLCGRVHDLVDEARMHAPPAVFVPHVQRLHAEVVRTFDIRLAPRIRPSLAAGRLLYKESCATCHGEDGRGDGPRAAALEPRPSDFHAAHVGERLSPYQAFNVLTHGIPGTAMAGFETLEEHERWDLAFWVLALRHPAVVPAIAVEGVPEPSLAELARTTDAALAARLADRSPTERATLLARWRRVLPQRLE